MSELTSRLTQRVMEFQRMLDAGENRQPTERKSFNIITRESAFSSSLRPPTRNDAPQVRRPVYSITVSDFPIDFFEADFNGTLPLINVITRNDPGGLTFIYQSERKSAKSTDPGNPGLVFTYFYEAEISVPVQSVDKDAPWSLFCAVDDNTIIQTEFCNIGVPKGDVGPGPDTTILLTQAWNISAG